MDNFTHSLAGWALGQAGLKTKSRKGLAALILGANAPDIDVFFGWAPWEPLATHRGFTHSLVGGVVILPLMLWALLLLLDHWQVRRGSTFKSGLALDKKWLLALCTIGALTHPLLDLQTTYSVQLLSPFSGAWFHTDSLFIIDVWLWALLAVGIAVSRWREQRGRDWARPVLGALAIMLVYLGFNIGLSDTALAAVRQRHPAATEIFASPPPVWFWQRRLSWRQGNAVSGADFAPFSSGLGPSAPPVPDRLGNPLVQRAIREDPSLRKFLYWSILPVAEVERERCTATVTIGDARYGNTAARSRLSRQTTLRLC